MQATPIRGPNAFATTLHTLHKFHVTDGQNTRDQITRIEGQNACD